MVKSFDYVPLFKRIFDQLVEASKPILYPV